LILKARLIFGWCRRWGATNDLQDV
jgi:hypothetical protein